MKNIYISWDMGDKKNWKKQWTQLSSVCSLTVSIKSAVTNSYINFDSVKQAIDFREGNLKGKKILDIKDAELRRTMFEEVGVKELIEDLSLELKDFSDVGKFWVSREPVKEFDDIPAQHIKIFEGPDASTGRIYYMRAHQDATTVEEAKCSTFLGAWAIYKKTGVMPQFIYET